MRPHAPHVPGLDACQRARARLPELCCSAHGVQPQNDPGVAFMVRQLMRMGAMLAALHTRQQGCASQPMRPRARASASEVGG